MDGLSSVAEFACPTQFNGDFVTPLTVFDYWTVITVCCYVLFKY